MPMLWETKQDLFQKEWKGALGEMLDMSIQNYIDWYVKPVMKIRNGYGFQLIMSTEHSPFKGSWEKVKGEEGRFCS